MGTMAPQLILRDCPFMTDFHSKAHVSVGNQWEGRRLCCFYEVILSLMTAKITLGAVSFF